MKTDEMTNNGLPASVLTKRQVRTYGPKRYTENGRQYKITAQVRYDDQCGNGHNSFGITADIEEKDDDKWTDFAFGCCHEEVVKHFPELAPFIKWHLVSSDGPMHYIANTVYHAGDLDFRGGRKGEIRFYRYNVKVANGSLIFPENTAPHELFEEDKARQTAHATGGQIVPVPWILHEGKGRQLDFARSSAVWPEATDEELTAPGLEERLAARLPGLMSEFKQAVESLGFVY